eukprot:6463966-Prymnesium_polylepis.1
MPECDVNGKTVQLEDITHSKNCMVYCARQSCDAAVQFINHHKKELNDKCEQITYLHHVTMLPCYSDATRTYLIGTARNVRIVLPS